MTTSVPNETDNMLPEATGNSLESLPDKTSDGEKVPEATKAPLNLQDKTTNETITTVASAQKEQLNVGDCVNTEATNVSEQPETLTSADKSNSAEVSKGDIGSISPTLPLDKPKITTEDETIEKVIGEISYSEHSDEPRNETTLEDIPLNVTSMQLIETSGVVSDVPEFIHTPDTILTNSSSGSSPPQ